MVANQPQNESSPVSGAKGVQELAHAIVDEASAKFGDEEEVRVQGAAAVFPNLLRGENVFYRWRAARRG